MLPGGCTMTKSRYGITPQTKAQRVPEQDPVVVFGHAEQVTGHGQLVHPQKEGDRRARGDRHGHGRRTTDSSGRHPSTLPAGHPRSVC